MGTPDMRSECVGLDGKLPAALKAMVKFFKQEGEAELEAQRSQHRKAAGAGQEVRV